MTTMLRVLALATITLAAAGCARFEIYSNEKLAGEETGIKFYTSKPYVLVARVGGDKPLEIKVVYLPDLKNPLYARARSGLGSANLTMSLNEAGMLTAFGQQTDTKIPELITSFGELAKAVAAARKVTDDDTHNFELYEVVVDNQGVTALRRVDDFK